MSTLPTPLGTASCTCRDPQTDLVRDLINDGLTPLEAAMVAFGGAPTWDAPRATWSAWIRVYVNDLGDRARAALCLPGREAVR